MVISEAMEKILFAKKITLCNSVVNIKMFLTKAVNQSQWFPTFLAIMLHEWQYKYNEMVLFFFYYFYFFSVGRSRLHCHTSLCFIFQYRRPFIFIEFVFLFWLWSCHLNLGNHWISCSCSQLQCWWINKRYCFLFVPLSFTHYLWLCFILSCLSHPKVVEVVWAVAECLIQSLIYGT